LFYIGYGSSKTSWDDHNEYVADEMDTFNFITCVTSDTFWSVAELFQRPYEPMVWTCLGITVLASTCILLGMKLYQKVKFSLTKLITSILFNLIEVGVSPGILMGHNLKILFAAWLLMSIVLTNSYKGLLISYLSVPWEPDQDFNYFEQFNNTGFALFSPVSLNNEIEYWERCYGRDQTLILTQTFCYNHRGRFGYMTELFEYAMDSITYNILRKQTKLNIQNEQYAVFFAEQLIAFPNNESQEVYMNLASGNKMMIAGLNSELDKMLSKLKPEYPRTTFFRGKEKFWPHTKSWKFLKISYSQPRTQLIQLMNSGIYQFWKYWLRDRTFLESKRKTDAHDSPDPLSLRSCASFMFIVLSIGLVTAAPLFLAEHAYCRLTKYSIRHRVKFVKINPAERLLIASIWIRTKFAIIRREYIIVNVYVIVKSWYLRR